MKVQIHNKLVRDRIPEHLKEKEIDAQVEVVEDEVRHLRLLLDKLEEEAQEATMTFEDQALLEELGDMETVIDGILLAKGWTREELRAQQDKKDEENGKLEKKIFLVKTTEKEE